MDRRVGLVYALLKAINDERGHPAGDDVLRAAAHAIKLTMRVTMPKARDAIA